MRAFQISQFGLEHLRPVELPKPTPGPGSVLIRVAGGASRDRTDDLAIANGALSQTEL